MRQNALRAQLKYFLDRLDWESNIILFRIKHDKLLKACIKVDFVIRARIFKIHSREVLVAVLNLEDNLHF